MPHVSQIPLVSAITKHLEKRDGITHANCRQLGAVIKAANLICGEFAREHEPATPNMGLDAWLKSDDTGVSSEYMAGELSGKFHRQHGYPHDPDDLGRCIRLLEAEPSLRANLPKLADGHGPQWAALIGAWEELEALYREELPNGQAPKTLARMQELLGEP